MTNRRAGMSIDNVPGPDWSGDGELTDRITLSEADYVRLMDAIANPPEPTEALKRVLRGRKESP